MPEEETPSVKVFEEPMERFMIIKAGLAKNELNSLKDAMEAIEGYLHKLPEAVRMLSDPAKEARAVDIISGNLTDLRTHGIQRFVEGITKEGFYPSETFASLTPMIEAFVTFTQSKIASKTPVSGYSNILGAAKALKAFMEAHRHEVRDLPETEARINSLQSVIGSTCAMIIHALGIVPESTTPATPTDPAGVKREAKNILDSITRFKTFTEKTPEDVRTNPVFAVNLKYWIERGVFYFGEARKSLEGLAKANGNQPARNMAATLATFSNEAAKRLDQLRFSKASGHHMERAGVKELIRAVQELGELASASGGTVVADIKDEVRQTDMACRELLGLLDTLSTTPFYGSSGGGTTTTEEEKEEEEESEEEEKEGRKIAREEAEISSELKEEIDRLNNDLLSKVRAEENAINQLSHYLNYLIQVRGWNKPYKDEEALRQMFPSLIRLEPGFEFKIHELYDKYNLTIWNRFWKDPAEERLRKLAAIEADKIEKLRERVLKHYQSKKGRKGKLGLEEDKKYNQFYAIVARIQKKLRERNDKFDELAKLVSSIPKEISSHTKDSISELVKRANQLEKTTKDHPRALNECIEGLQDFISAHNQMAKISKRVEELIKGLNALEKSWEIDALKEGREFNALLTQLRLKEEGGIIKK